jgi:hypothetical protein
MAKSSRPTAQVFLEVVDTAFEKGLKGAEKAMKHSALEMNAALELVGKGMDALKTGFDALVRVGEFVFERLERSTGPLKKQIDDLKASVDLVGDEFALAVVSSGSFQAAIGESTKVTKIFVDFLQSPQTQAMIQIFFDTLLKGVRVALKGLGGLQKGFGFFFDALAAGFMGISQLRSPGKIFIELRAQQKGLDESTGSWVHTLNELDKSLEKVIGAGSGAAGLTILNKQLAEASKNMKSLAVDTGKMFGPSAQEHFDRVMSTATSHPLAQGQQTGALDVSQGIAGASKVPDSFREANDAIKVQVDRTTDLAMQFSGAVASAFSGAIQSAVSGQESFGKAVLRGLGNIMTMMGEQLMVMGAGAMAAGLLGQVSPIFAGITGAGAGIASGAAVVAAGGLMVAAGTAIGGSGAGVGASTPTRTTTGGVGAGTGAANSGFGGFGTAGLGQTGPTIVNVSITGPVGNPRKAGREIQNVLNESKRLGG